MTAGGVKKKGQKHEITFLRADICIGSPESYSLDEKRRICEGVEASAAEIEKATKAEDEPRHEGGRSRRDLRARHVDVPGRGGARLRQRAARRRLGGSGAQGGGEALSAQADDPISVTATTHSMSSGTYKVTGDMSIGPDGKTGNGIQIEKGAKVLLYIEEGATLTVTGKQAEKKGVGRAAILLPEGATLTAAGGGTLNATGDKAAAGSNGGKARESATLEETHNQMSQLVGMLYAESGDGGKGGKGGGGAGAGIGTDGGSGGNGGAGGKYRQGNASKSRNGSLDVGNTYGYEGVKGSEGSVAEPAGTLIVTGKVAVNAKGGAAGKGGKAGKRGTFASMSKFRIVAAAGTSGGSCPTPKTAAFYTYKDSSSSNPKVTCTSGHGVTRSATPLGTLQEFVNKGGSAVSVSGGTYTYDGKPHGASVSGGKLSGQSAGALGAQAGGDGSGAVVVDGVEVKWAVAYYDEAGKRLASEPVK